MNCFASWIYLFLRQSLSLLVDEKDVMSKGEKKDSEMQIEENTRDTTKSRPLRNPVISKTRSINITCYDQPEQEDRIEPRVAVRLKLRQARWNPLHTFLVQLNSSIWEVLTWPRTGIVTIYHVSVDDRNREFKCKALKNVCWKLGKNLTKFESCMCEAVRPTENAQEIQSCAPKKIGDLTAADHTFLNEYGESRNSNKYAVIVQDLATQWLQTCPCKTKISQGTEKSLKQFVKPKQSSKVIYTDNSLKFGKVCADLQCIHRSETNDFAERAVRRLEDDLQRYFCRSGSTMVDWCHGMLLLSA